MKPSPRIVCRVYRHESGQVCRLEYAEQRHGHAVRSYKGGEALAWRFDSVEQARKCWSALYSGLVAAGFVPQAA